MGVQQIRYRDTVADAVAPHAHDASEAACLWAFRPEGTGFFMQEKHASCVIYYRELFLPLIAANSQCRAPLNVRIWEPPIRIYRFLFLAWGGRIENILDNKRK
jgi:hypothetical protein